VQVENLQEIFKHAIIYLPNAQNMEQLLLDNSDVLPALRLADLRDTPLATISKNPTLEIGRLAHTLTQGVKSCSVLVVQ